MLIENYANYRVDENLIFSARLKAASYAKAQPLPHPAERESLLQQLRNIPQAALIRGLALEEQMKVLASALRLAADEGFTSNITEGFDRASNYLDGKLISEPAVAGFWILTVHSLFRQTGPHDVAGTVRHLAHLYLTIFIWKQAAEHEVEASHWDFITV